jgi:hypothetical protein
MVTRDDVLSHAGDMPVEDALRRVRGELGGAPRWVRQGMAALAAVNLVIGAWGTFLPRSFYDEFPGGPMQWVAGIGPYNEHLVIDVGASYLMMAVLLALAAWSGGRRIAQVALVAVLVQAVPHAVFHLTHLGPLSTGEAIGLSASVLGAVVLPVVLLAGTRRRRAPAGRPDPHGNGAR